MSVPLYSPAVDSAPVLEVWHDTGLALEAALLPLFAYCEQTLGRAALSDWAFQHVRRLQAVFAAVQAYDEQTKQLLDFQTRNVFALNAHLHYHYTRRPPPTAPDLDAGALLKSIPKTTAFQNGLGRLSWPPEKRNAYARINSHTLAVPAALPHA